MNAEKSDKAYISVETENQSGNAVIAMKVNGKIYWSWHIWCTDYDPNLEEGQQEFNGYTWMDRNLGATLSLRDFYINGGGKIRFHQLRVGFIRSLKKNCIASLAKLSLLLKLVYLRRILIIYRVQ